MARSSTSDIPFRPRRTIEEAAMEVLRRHNLLSIPVDLVTLANREGIKVHHAKFSQEGISGLIAKRGDATTILIDYDERPFRKRFTIAHELGHHFLHLHEAEEGEFVDSTIDLLRQPTSEDEGESGARRAEIQANIFAAALIMPESLVREKWPQCDRSLSQLAQEFNVSEEAMAIRLDTLGLIQ